MENGKTSKKAGRGFLRIIFSRTGMILILLGLEVAIFVWLSLYVEFHAYIYFLINLASVGVLIWISDSESNPAFKLTWILFVVLFPIFGTLFYIFVRVQPGSRSWKKRLVYLREETAPYMQQDPAALEGVWAEKSDKASLAHYMAKEGGFPVYHNTEVTFFPLGEDKFKSLLEELKKAEHFIFMEYFIVEEGYMWGSVLDILKEKAADGVEVRFMYDGMCAISDLPYNYPKKLEKIGIQCKMSNPMRPFLSSVQNNRDHRKICVIDGETAYTGGVNLGDEYINRKVRFGHWKDTAIMLKGDAVQSLTMIFLQMWNLDNKKEEKKEHYDRYLTPKSSRIKPNLGQVIPYADSPFNEGNLAEEVYFHILDHATQYVHIMTPYLILDSQMIDTLTRAAKGDVEVIIIMPHIPDKGYAFAAAKTYFKRLIEEGVQIYEYTPGFVHAKIFVSDDTIATVGTINLDYRSLYLHFECGALLYDSPVIGNIEQDFQETLKKCQKQTLDDVKNRPVSMKIEGEIMRLMGPLL